ncbi:HNH endonuclease [bacterium]|nr:HNH endonuclease [bacterium]
MKTCSKCKEIKELEEFSKDSQKSDGYYSSCRICQSAKNKMSREAHPEKYRERARKYREENREKCREACRRNYRKHKSYYVSKDARRRAFKLKAQPAWIGGEENFLLEEIYSLAKMRTEMTNLRWEVDHIIPLQGKNVCGLHVPSNLQIITEFENRSKSNTFNI